MHRFDVIIVGAGIVGASFALALRDAGLAIALIDPRAAPAVPDGVSWDSRVYTVSPGNADWLAELGAWTSIPEPRVSRVEAMLVYGDRSVSPLRFDAYESGLRELAYVVENGWLQHALWQTVEEQASISFRAGARCVEVEWGRSDARLVLEDGTALGTRLIVGADGADSWVRARAGIRQHNHDYAQLGVVANFEAERPHAGTAFQWFLGGSILALLPLPGHRVSMVWSTSRSHAQRLLAASPSELSDAVGEASARVLGELKLITPPTAFPLARQSVDRLVEPRAALIGDAAHGIHPLAGQGVNLGLRDARALAQVLVERGAQNDCGDYGLLRRYERARKEDITALELTTHALEKLFSTPAVWLAGLRNVGLALVDAQPAIKNLLVRRAVA